MIWACAYYTNFTEGWFLWELLSFSCLFDHMSVCTEIGNIWACSDHGQPRYQIWIKCNKRQMTSCVHKMCGWTYGQTNMKMAITLAKINRLIFVRVIVLFMFVWPYVRLHILCTQLVICLLFDFIHTWYLGWLSQKSTFREIGIICTCSDHGQPRYQIWIKCDKRLVAYTRCADGRMFLAQIIVLVVCFPGLLYRYI
jgi:hypothetical protein